jgi:Kelch motif/Galactose oxidase, central domain
MRSQRRRRGALLQSVLLVICLGACESGPRTTATPASPAPIGPTAAASGAVIPGDASSAPIAPGTLGRVGSLRLPRAAHTASLLPDGRVLVAGGCTQDSCEGVTATTEIVNVSTGASEPGPDLSEPRVGHAAVTLSDGRVLLVGGFGAAGVTATTDVFDAVSGTVTAGPVLLGRRADPFVVLLSDGAILVAGGFDGSASVASAELLDAGAVDGGTFRAIEPLSVARSSHAGALLRDGRVLVSGGSSGGSGARVLASAEIFDPGTGSWSGVGEMSERRYKTGAITLADGRVLVVGGSNEEDGAGRYRSAEVFVPKTGAFTAAAELAFPRYKIAGSLVALPDGRVLVGGGAPSAELFDPAAGTFAVVPSTTDARPDQSFATAVLLPDGSVFVAGGYDERIRLTDQVLRFVP